MTSVLMVTPGGLEHGGGIGRMIGYLADAWQGGRDAETVEIVDTRGPGRLDVAPFYFARALMRVAQSALERPKPLLHVHVAGRGSTLRKAILVPFAHALGLRTVLHLHDFDYAAFLDTLPWWVEPAVAATFQRADAVVVLGERDRDTVVGRLGVRSDRALVVPNAVPPAPPATPREPGPVRILFLGNPSRRKGVHDLIAAFDRPALRDRGDWTATLAGGGGEVQGFREDVALAGLADRVALPGWLGRAQVQALLAEADVLVLPSYGEGLAMSVLEAMAHGLCVVCTPVGALAEAITDGIDGRLVATGDVDGLATALAACIADPALRTRLGEAARARFEAAYAIADYPAKIEAAYALARR